MAEKYIDTFSANDVEYPIKDAINTTVRQHANLYRGKELGTAVTAEQWAQIAAGTFDDLYIGDYWKIGNVNYRIADINYWLNCGDTACTKPHLVIVPDTNLATCKMNDTNITEGAYIGSDFYTGNNDNAGKATAVAAIEAAFGAAHILSHRQYFANAVTNGKQSAGAWYDSTIDLMNERMVYGGPCFAPGCDGSTVPTLYTIDKSQLALFRLDPTRITNRATWWLRDVVSAAYFAIVGYDGGANCDNASDSLGVRPAFGIC